MITNIYSYHFSEEKVFVQFLLDMWSGKDPRTAQSFCSFLIGCFSKEGTACLVSYEGRVGENS